MTELEDKASRRAKRREQQQNASTDGGSSASSTESSAEEQSLALGNPRSEDDESAADESAADEESSEQSPAREIRDRNARIRAKAAEERRAKREQRERPTAAVASGLDAAERMDDIFVRTTHAATGFIRQNFKWMQWVVILGVLGGFGTQGYRYLARSKAAKSADALAIGLIAEGGTLQPATDDEKSGINPEISKLDPRPVYATEQARILAAEEAYRKTVQSHGDTGAGWVARLGLAGVLFDQKKWDEALTHYRAVRNSEIAKQDGDILGRSLEGIGLTLEAKGDREGALTAFRELTNQEQAPWLATLGLYQQARLLLADGKKDKAKELATKATERLEKDAKDRGPEARPGYLSESLKLLMAQIDPAAASKTPNIQEALTQDPAKLQKLIEDLQKQKPAAPAPGGGS